MFCKITEKQSYPDAFTAVMARSKMEKKYGGSFSIYFCEDCLSLHIGHSFETETRIDRIIAELHGIRRNVKNGYGQNKNAESVSQKPVILEWTQPEPRQSKAAKGREEGRQNAIRAFNKKAFRGEYLRRVAFAESVWEDDGGALDMQSEHCKGNIE